VEVGAAGGIGYDEAGRVDLGTMTSYAEASAFLFFNDGSQFGLSISRTDFRRMWKAGKLEAMIDWFHQNYEDPAHSTPYESAEGGYQWIWGGPYNAREELYSKFDGLASEALIEEAVEEVQRDGLFDWAPVRTADDYDEDEFEPEVEGRPINEC
jgi:hypothetical protein